MSEFFRLTDAANNQASFVIFDNTLSSAQGFKVTFDFYAYGGNGGDGVSFFVLNGDVNPTAAGAFGGSLGYGPRVTNAENIPGIQGGYFAVGFDEFGNFSNPIEGRVGGPAQVPDSIAVRGSEANSYQYLTGTGTLPGGIDNTAPGANRENSRRKAEVELSPQGILNVRFDLNNDGDFLDEQELAVSNYNLVAANGALPSSLRFGFAASTGENINIHEIGAFTATTFTGAPLAGGLVRRLTGSGSGSTIVGGSGSDSIVGGSNTITGGRGGDRFIYSGRNKVAALRRSTFNRRGRIRDFNQREGDRIQLDFDNNLATSNRPTGLFNAGVQQGARNLQQAASRAFSDRNPRRGGNQALAPDQAVFFGFRGRTYLAINDGTRSFSPRNDFMLDVTGVQFRAGDARPGVLAVNNYFV